MGRAGRTPAGQEIAVAVTDTDDSLEEIKAGSHVAIIFPDRQEVPGNRMGTLFLPNTVAIIRGCPDPQGARKLVDFLLMPIWRSNSPKPTVIKFR